MYRKYQKELNAIYDLSVRRNIEEKEWRKNQGYDKNSFIHLDQIRDYDPDNEMLAYLKSLQSEVLKVIVTTMYLGRDYMPETEEEYEERMLHNFDCTEDEKDAPFLQSKEPNELFSQWFTEFSDWDDERLIMSIEEKSPLDRYLERAFIVLSIR